MTLNKGIVTVAFTLLAMSGCKDMLYGVLSTSKGLTLKNKKNQSLAIAAGSQEVKIGLGQDKLILKLKVNNKDEEVQFKSDRDLKSLLSGERVVIASNVTGQPVDIDGTYTDGTLNGTEQEGTRSCTYYTHEYRCSERPKQVCSNFLESGPMCRTEYHKVCGDVSVAHSGTQRIRYYISIFNQSFKIDLIDPQSRKVVGTIRSADSDSKRVVTASGPCMKSWNSVGW